MELEKYTERSKGFIQAAQNLALRSGHQRRGGGGHVLNAQHDAEVLRKSVIVYLGSAVATDEGVAGDITRCRVGLMAAERAAALGRGVIVHRGDAGRGGRQRH